MIGMKPGLLLLDSGFGNWQKIVYGYTICDCNCDNIILLCFLIAVESVNKFFQNNYNIIIISKIVITLACRDFTMSFHARIRPQLFRSLSIKILQLSLIACDILLVLKIK